MAFESSLILKIKIIAALVVATLGLAAQAKAEETGPAGESQPTQTCVFKDLVSSEVCPAYTTSRALEVLGVGDETVIFVEKDASEKLARRHSESDRVSIVASSRIEDAVRLHQVDEDDAMLLEREVQELSGARYELPTSRREITRTLGFPENAEIAAEDWIEMLRVHAEMTLSLSAQASRFLLEQMGLVARLDSATVTAATPAATAAAKSAAVVTAPSPTLQAVTEPVVTAETPVSNPVVVEAH